MAAVPNSISFSMQYEHLHTTLYKPIFYLSGYRSRYGPSVNVNTPLGSPFNNRQTATVKTCCCNLDEQTRPLKINHPCHHCATVYCLSNQKFERLGGPLDETVIISVHKYNAMTPRFNLTFYFERRVTMTLFHFKGIAFIALYSQVQES